MNGLLTMVSLCAVPEFDLWSLEPDTYSFGITGGDGRFAAEGWGYGVSDEVFEFQAGDAPVFTTTYVPEERHEPRLIELGPPWGLRLRCSQPNVEGASDMVDCVTGELILAGDRGDAVPDIDGDGRVDVHGRLAVHLQRDGGWETMAYPQVSLQPYEYIRYLPVGDLTDDGLADVLVAVDTGLTGLGKLTDGLLYLFEGTPAGYSEQPLWLAEVDTPIVTAFGMQMDADPELELFAQGGDDWGIGYPDSTVFLILDPTDDGVVATRRHELDEYKYGPRPPLSLPYEDVDGDGLGDVLYFSSGAICEAEVMGRLLVSSRGWDPLQPWFVLPAYQPVPPTKDPWWTSGTNKGAVVADLDGDGRLDIGTVYRGNSEFDTTYVQIWYPLREPEPTMTADTAGLTADTGPTTGTYSVTETSDTSPGIDTALSSPAPSNGHGRERGCGCDAAASSPFFVAMLLPLLARRRRRASESSRALQGRGESVVVDHIAAVQRGAVVVAVTSVSAKTADRSAWQVALQCHRRGYRAWCLWMVIVFVAALGWRVGSPGGSA